MVESKGIGRLLSSLTKLEKTMIAVGVIVLLGCLWALSNDNFFFSDKAGSRPEIGEIVAAKNDTRHKQATSMMWFQAKNSQKVQLGDSVFTGDKSSATVALKKGGSVDIGENSLIVFSEIQGEALANINFGNFKVTSGGNLKLAINGQITTIQGKDSELQVFTDKNKKSQVRLIHGDAKIVQKDKTVNLNEANRETSFEAPAAEPVAVEPSPEPKPVLTPKSNVQSLRYTWRLYDLYTMDGEKLNDKPQLPSKVTKSVELAWSSSLPDPNQKVTFQRSQTPDFVDNDTVVVNGNAVHLNEVYLGANNWRISNVPSEWSAVEKFDVQPVFLPETVHVARRPQQIGFFGSVAKTPILLQIPFEAQGFVIEASATNNFEKGSNKIFWSARPKFQLSFYKPGTYYYHFRAVNSSQELTDWSSTEEFEVVTPKLLGSPEFNEQNITALTSENMELAWQGPRDAASYQVEFTDKSGKVIDSVQTSQNRVYWTRKNAGNYRAKVTAVDQYGRKGAPSDTASLTFRDKAPTPVPAEKEAVRRQVASQEENSSTLKMDKLRKEFNSSYSRSMIEVDGIVTDYQSSAQISQGLAAADKLNLGVRVRHWWDLDGIEAYLGQAVVTLAGPGELIKATTAEIRYLRRLFYSEPVAHSSQLQWTLFGGYTLYRDQGSSAFSTSYDLLKIGTRLDLPLYEHWGLGGEIALGYGFDATKEYEMAGHFDYYFNRNWSLGLGYRVRLLDAGSVRSAPSGLPFREGDTETMSALKYYY